MNLRQLWGEVAAVLENPDLRKVELAYIGFNAAEYGTWIAIMVFAYAAGGATAAGVMGALQMIPAAIFAPVAATLGDRFRRDHVLAAGYFAQALTMAATGMVMLAGGSLVVVFPFAAAAATAVALTRPIQNSLLPALARTPGELTAANVVGGWILGMGNLAGPLLVAGLLAVSSPGAAFLAFGLVCLCAGLPILSISPQPPPVAAKMVSEAEDIGHEMLAGFREIAGKPRQALVASIVTSNFILDGTIDVLLVIVSVRLLHAGNAGVGLLNAAVGVGAILGAVATLALVGRRQVAYPLLAGALAWCIGLAPIGIAPSTLIIPLLIVVAGTGSPVVSVSGQILLQRIVPNKVLSRVFGVMEGLQQAAYGVGMLAVPLVLALVGNQLAFLAIGLFLPAIIAVSWRRLRALDASTVVPEVQLGVLRSFPLFESLSPVILERLALELVTVEAASGETIIREGDQGDRFYLIMDGTVTVSTGDRHLASLGPGDFFGEIALLRSVPRTADVTAASDVKMFALNRDDFIEGVTGHAHAALAADAVIDKRLADLAAARSES